MRGRKSSKASVSRMVRQVCEALESRQHLTVATVTQFPLGITGTSIKSIALGADGNFWFTEPGAGVNPGRIGMMTPAGTVTQFAIPTATNKPQWIAAGPDGNMWFTESPGNAVARITPAGTITEFPLSNANSNPQQIISASDGNLWFTEFGANKIAKLTTAGTVTEFSTLFAPPPNDNPFGLVDRGDGNIWYVANGSSRVGRVSYSGSLAAETSVPTANSGPYDIARGPDGALWYTESNTDKIGRINDVFSPQTEYTLPAGTIPESIVFGPDGALYFTCAGSDRIGRIAVDSDVSNGGTPTISFFFNIANMANSDPTELVVGPDNNIWFTENGQDEIGRLNLWADPENAAALVVPHPVAGTSFSGEVATFTSTLIDSSASDFVANIDWGDGSLPTVGTIQKGAAGKFFVSGTHTYSTATPSGSPHTLTVTLDRRNGQPEYLVTTATSVDVDGSAGPALPLPTLSIGSATQNEGNSGTSSFSFTVTRSGDLSGPSSVLYSTADGSATSADNDYQPVSNTLAFGPGEFSKTVTVLVNGDIKAEANEAFSVTLSAAVGATIAAATGIGTITNDDHAPVAADDAYSTAFNTPLTVAASGVLGNDSDADGGTLTATNATTPLHGSVVLNANGSFVYTPTAGYTGADSFTYQASDGTNLSNIATVNLTVTAAPPPPAATLMINDASTSEGNSGLKTLTFTVTRSGDKSGSATVNYSTAAGTASSAGNDYVGGTGVVTFAAGESTRTITIQIKGDTTVEANETFKVVLSGAVGASISRATGTGTINNDDVAATPSKISIGGVSASETHSGLTAFSFKVTLDKPSASAVTVHYATADGTAKAGSDYNAASGTVTFAAGQTVATITVYVKGDKTKESDETFFVNLSSATNASITVGKATAIIKNDD